MLSINQLSLRLDETLILNNVNVALEAGELTVILGPNGAGKSSLLKVACGELKSAEGDVKFFSRALSSISLSEKALLMGVLPQHSLLEFPFSVKEVVSLGRIPHNTGFDIDSAIVTDALKLLDVLQFSEQVYTQLSGGEKQRVQLARVLAQVWAQDSILILDEPTAGLDFSHQKHIMQICKDKTASGSAVLMVLHDLNLAASFADKVIIMSDGEICAAGKPEEVLQEGLLEEVFKLKFCRVSHPDTGKQLFVS